MLGLDRRACSTPPAHAAYLADVRETLPLYAAEGIAHPGWLLRFANSALSRNVVLGPWIHVSSDLALLGTVPDGETVEARSVVLDEFERKGHRFVTLDVAISADDRPVQRITHTAIYRPRRHSPDPDRSPEIRWPRPPSVVRCAQATDVDDEAVAHPGLGDEVARVGPVGLQLAAQVGHVDPQVVALVAVAGTPHVLQQLALRDELAGVAHEHLEQLPLGRRQADRLARRVEHPLGGQVDGEVRRWRSSPPPRRRPSRRTAARSRASSSSIPNGFDT